ncbi:Flavin-linked sulfhydryl oxidase of the mitochondrial IMS [Balamuthia mandrillaris]
MSGWKALFGGEEEEAELEDTLLSSEPKCTEGVCKVRHNQKRLLQRQLARNQKPAAPRSSTEPHENQPSSVKAEQRQRDYEQDQPEEVDTQLEFWEMEDPPDVVDLGRAGWTLLHTTAAYYPDRPTPEQQAAVRELLRSLSKLYPCRICAEDLQRIMQKMPPQVESRQALSQWMCRAHNDVNRQLGKPLFPCERVDERWRVPLSAEEGKEKESKAMGYVGEKQTEKERKERGKE